MKTVTFEDRDDWLNFRLGKITGSRLGDIIVKRGTGRKIGFYQILAERLAIEENGDETPMDRGSRLEGEALEQFAQQIKKDVTNELVIWVSDINENIAYSPDGVMGDTAVAEVKCLSSARHLEAFFEKEIPSEYEAQYIQGFICNEKLETLYFVFYDPRVTCLPLHWIEVHREDVEGKIAEYVEFQKKTLAEIDDLVNQLTF